MESERQTDRSIDDKCRMCQNRCNVRFDVDSFGIVVQARRRLYAAGGETLKTCGNLCHLEGLRLDKAQRRIALPPVPDYIPTGGH